MERYSKTLSRWNNWQSYDYYYSNRRWLSAARLYLYGHIVKFHYGLLTNQGDDFFNPGLEVKFACEAAERTGAKLEFLGPETD